MSYMEQEVRARKAQGEDNAYIATGIGIDEARVERCLLGEHVVRVMDGLDDPMFLCFVQCMAQGGLIKHHQISAGSVCFDILPPMNKDSKKWSGELAKFMQIQGFNAVVAPRWADGS